ncbi:MAG: c-type cytochrome [Bacteroidota bacterium]
MHHKKIPLFWSTAISLAVVYLFLNYLFPYLSMFIAGTENPLPVPSALMVMFMSLAIIGVLIHISTDDERLREFARPVGQFLEGSKKDKTVPYSTNDVIRMSILAALPLLAGWFVYDQTSPSIRTPTLLRIQHPTIPGSYEKPENPFQTVDAETKARYIKEGRVLYQINCRPCHGTKADGDGPMAPGFRLKPANFRDPGTIATVVEAYAFWRIKEGGPGLPPEASPWDSSMPAWKDELSDEEIWKIIMAEYETAGVEPRKPERLD